MYPDAYAHLYQKMEGFKIKIFAPNNKLLQGYLSAEPSTRSTYDIAMKDATIDGLITMDEAKYAGGSGKSNSSYYLYINEQFWAISPALYDGYNAGIVRIEQNGIISNYDNSYEMGVRPVINLKATTEILRGNGTLAQPYFVTEFPQSGGGIN